MCEPKFHADDEAEYNGNTKWAPVRIQSQALRWAAPRNYHGYVYLVRRKSDQHIYVAHEENLRRVEQWEPCPGRHRFADRPEWGQPTNMERLVE